MYLFEVVDKFDQEFDGRQGDSVIVGNANAADRAVALNTGDILRRCLL